MKKHILFDFDGVILDTFAVCYGINLESTPELAEADYKSRMEGNIYDHPHTLKEPVFMDDFFKKYVTRTTDLTPYEGIAEAIEELSTSYNLAIISSSDSGVIRRILAKTHLQNFFDDVWGSDVDKSKVVKMRQYLKKHSAQPEDCLFITDTLGDLREAAQVGICCLAVSWGVHDIATLKQGTSEAILSSPHELAKQVTRLLG